MKLTSALWVIPALTQAVTAARPLSHLTGSLTALLFSFPVSAVNSIKFINHCPYDFYFWTVNSPKTGYDGHDWERITVPGGHGSMIHNMVNTEHLGSGMSLKLRDFPQYRVAPAGIVQVEYHFEPSTDSIWYDLSTIDCVPSHGPENPSFCPLVDGGIRMYVPDADSTNCPQAWCDGDGCHNTYMEHGSWYGEPTFKCHIGVDVIVETCFEGVGPQTFGGRYPTLPDSDPAMVQSPGELSVDGTCGANSHSGFVCPGTIWGDCCSHWGWCGVTPEHCDAGCQSAFGACSYPAVA